MKERISEIEISNTLKRALKRSQIDNDDTAIIFYDLDFLTERIVDLKNHFPESTLHTIAVKSNPIFKILEKIRKLNVGLEVASLPELHFALKAGFDTDSIIFDSPAKTIEEIEFALKNGVKINADSFDELDRISELLEKNNTKSKIGIRINPQVGTGSIRSTSVADKISKFGIPIENNRKKLICYFVHNIWLTGIHIHIGSQGCPINLLVDGINKVYELVKEINQKLNDRKIEIFDIGGGLPVSYNFDLKAADIYTYKNEIIKRIPDFFKSDFQIVTEFGRYIHANTGWAISKVEYVKKEQDYNIIMTHLGADMFIRECYNPNDWSHEITVLDKYGNLKNKSETNNYIIAGPLCFAGDVIAKDIELPTIEEGDFIVIHDIGAYTLSMWSRYNSRQTPKVIGYSYEKSSFEILKKKESLKMTLNFWS